MATQITHNGEVIPQAPDKDPDSEVDYGLDWSSYLEAGETISTSTWILDSGISEESSTASGTATTIVVSGGTEHETYLVTNRITTTGGSVVRTDDRSFYIRVRTL